MMRKVLTNGSIKKNTKGLTLIEILTVIGIVMLLAALLFPVYSMAKGAALRVDRTSRLKQLAAALEMYKTDNNGAIFRRGRGPIGWQDQLAPYLKNSNVTYNPAYHGELRVPMAVSNGFVFNTCAIGYAYPPRPNPVVFFETAPLVVGNHSYSFNDSYYPDRYFVEKIRPEVSPVGGKYLADHDRGGSLYAKWDGSVKWINYESTTDNDFGKCSIPRGVDSLFAVQYARN